MLTRRSFLGLSMLAASAAACRPSGGRRESAGDLPPAIAALEPYEEKPVPISADEPRARLEKARE